MATIDIDIDAGGLDGIPDDINDFVLALAYHVEAEAKRRIQQGPKSGRTYRRRAITKSANGAAARELGLRPSRTKPGRAVAGYNFHRASAPGESPATDIGNLVNSIGTSQPQLGVAEVTVNAEYGGFLEFGTSDIAPRLFVQPAIDFVLERQLPAL